MRPWYVAVIQKPGLGVTNRNPEQGFVPGTLGILSTWIWDSALDRSATTAGSSLALLTQFVKHVAAFEPPYYQDLKKHLIKASYVLPHWRTVGQIFFATFSYKSKDERGKMVEKIQ